MFSATDRAGTQLWGGGGVFPSWAVLGVMRAEKGRGKDVDGATRLTSNRLPLPPVFLTMAHGWRWDCELDGHLGKDTQHCRTIYAAKKILQKNSCN